MDLTLKSRAHHDNDVFVVCLLNAGYLNHVHRPNHLLHIIHVPEYWGDLGRVIREYNTIALAPSSSTQRSNRGDAVHFEITLSMRPGFVRVVSSDLLHLVQANVI